MLSSGRFKNKPNKLDLFPLPYDYELEDRMGEDEMLELYNKHQPYL